MTTTCVEHPWSNGTAITIPECCRTGRKPVISVRTRVNCQDEVAPFTSPLLHPFTDAVSYLTPISVPLPLSATSPVQLSPSHRLSYSPRRVVGYGNGIRIVISNRATTHEPLPCRSKFVNGLRIPGLPRGSY